MRLNQKGAIHLLIPLILFMGIGITVYLTTSGNSLKIFSGASSVKSTGPTTSFTLSPNLSTLGVGSTVAVKVLVRSDISTANLFTAKLNFNKELLGVESVDYSSTMVKNWVEQYSENGTGEISLTGGVPAPGFQTNSSSSGAIMAVVYFKALKAGSGNIYFTEESAIYDNANNLNILSQKEGTTFSVSDSVADLKCKTNSDCKNGQRCQIEACAQPQIYCPPGTDQTSCQRTLCSGICVTDTKKPEPSLVDTLDYFISNHQDKGLTGTHPFSQTIEDQKSYYVKWADNSYEMHTWDNEYIYLKEDHSSEAYGNGGNSYIFSPGVWMKRQMKVGEKIDGRSNMIQWYKGACEKLSPTTEPFPYEITLERKESQFDLGGDLGKQEVIVLKYDWTPGNDSGAFERFYYSKEWGWVKWESYNKSNPQAPVHTSIFNKITSNLIRPNKAVSCLPSSPLVTARSGDGNKDGKITLADLSVMLTDWQKRNDFRLDIDLNKDNFINTLDLSLMFTLLRQKGVIKG